MTDKKPRRHRFLKWALGVLIFVALVLVGASWYISAKFKPLIERELKELVKKSTNGLYSIEFASINTNLLSGSATISAVNIFPDTNVYKLLIAEKKAPNNLFYIKLQELSIKHFHPFALYFNKKVEVNLLLFERPKVTMVNRHFDFNDNRPPRPRKSPYDYIAKLFKSLRVETIDFHSVNFKYVNNNGSRPEIDSVANLNVTLKDWLIDSLSSTDTTRLYLLKDVNIYVNDYSYATPDSMYKISVNQFDFNASTRKVNIKKFALTPRYSEQQFAKVAGYAKDRFHISLNNISLGGIDLPAYVQRKELFADEMTIDDGFVAVFNNNSYAKLDKIRTGSFPHQLLQQLKTALTIKKIKLSNIDVSYAEFDRKSKQRGKITFQKTSGTISNATNEMKVKNVNPIMLASLNSYVMGQGKLQIDFNFDLNSATGDFGYKGALINLDGRKLNQLVRPLGMLQVNKGMINKLAFNINANQDVAKGKVDFLFNELAVSLLKKEEGKERLRKKSLLSILANALVLYSDNPSKDGKYTSASINYRREPKASFFNFIWRTLFQGVKYSVGVTPQKEAEIKAQVAKFEQMKDDREARKLRRLQRKASRAN
jgi:hypothetical protein